MDLEKQMKLTSEEKEMLCRIVNNPYHGGAYNRATWIDIICPTKADKAMLETLCHKGLVETGLGGTVAGDPSEVATADFSQECHKCGPNPAHDCVLLCVAAVSATPSSQQPA